MLWKACEFQQAFSVRLAKLQYNCLRWRVRGIDSGYMDSQDESLKNMYYLDRMMQLSIAEKDDKLAYQTVELMKKFFGEHTVQQEYSGRLLRLCSTALLAKRYKTVEILLDTYKPLIRRLDELSCSKMLEEFVILIDLAKKSGQAYIMEKIAKCVFECSHKIGAAGYLAAINAIKDVGLNAIKNHDAFLLKSASASVKFFSKPQSLEQEKALILLLRVWLHQILKRDDQQSFQAFRAMVLSLHDAEKLPVQFVESMIAESDNLAGLVGANIHMMCRKPLVSFLVEISQNSVNYLQKTSYCIGQMVKMSIALHGLSAGFDILLPLLEHGRGCLKGELKFVKSVDSMRQRHLFAIIRETVILIKSIAKQEGGVGEVEVVLEIRKYWQARYQREGNRHSVDQFCQLLLRQMLKDRQRLSKRLCPSSKKLLDKPLFDIFQIKKLGLES